MKIIPVDSSNIDEAIILLNKVFPHDASRAVSPEISLRCSLDREKYKDFYKDFNLIKTTPFVLIENGKIIGTTGLYYLTTDKPETAWLGWFCIAPEKRKKGYGKMLLEWTISKAKEEGNSVLKLYTSDYPEYVASEKLYDKFGFKTTGKDQIDGEDVIYKEINL